LRAITHIDEPELFRQWRKKNISKNWSDFSGTAAYLDLRKKLISEQEEMCAYCEIALKKETDAHIEHLQDKDTYPKECFNLANLMASCQHNDCCGHKKDRGYFKEMVSPFDSKCQSRFTYTGTGKIIPIDEGDTNASQTIELLGLNCKRLKDQRLSLIKAIDCDNTSFSFSLKNCIEWHKGFFTVIQYVKNKHEA